MLQAAHHQKYQLHKHISSHSGITINSSIRVIDNCNCYLYFFPLGLKSLYGMAHVPMLQPETGVICPILLVEAEHFVTSTAHKWARLNIPSLFVTLQGWFPCSFLHQENPKKRLKLGLVCLFVKAKPLLDQRMMIHEAFVYRGRR